jgi:amidase
MTLTRQSATQLLTNLQSGTLSAADLMQATLAQIDQVNGGVNAIVALRDGDDLMAEARAMDDGPNRGPLHGLPIAVKDLVNVAGVVSSHGSPTLAGFVPDRDDLIAARMRAAGAILIGKTNTPEFGLGSHTFNPVYGATRNPYDAGRTCGGSSGGAAVALATGMVALADGSDMMGSLRNPAAWNNVYGFRPSWGRVPSEPMGDTFLHQLATLGPMARSPEDLALLLDVISGPDPRQPHGYACDAVAPVTAADPKGMRIGWLGDWGGAFAMEPGILEQSETALTVMQGLGAQVDHVEPPFSADAMWDSWITLRSWAVAAGLAPLLAQNAPLKDTAIWETERGLALSAMDVHRASVIRSDWFKCAAKLFETYDALVLPSVQVWPFDVDIPYPTEIAGQGMDTYHRWMQVVIPVSLIGLPCLAAPAGFGTQGAAAGLPVGVQIFGPCGSDAALLALGAAYHAATNWPQTRPAM